MEWREVIEHPSLKDLPFKIETNEWGKIMMTPATYTHGLYQGRIIGWFERHGEEGRASGECPIQTSKGVKVADVAWASRAFLKKHGVHSEGNIHFPNPRGELERSELFGEFPEHIDIDFA